MNRNQYDRTRLNIMIDMLDLGVPEKCEYCWFFAKGAFNDTYKYYCYVQYHELHDVNICNCDRDIILKRLLERRW